LKVNEYKANIVDKTNTRKEERQNKNDLEILYDEAVIFYN
jgi:hypothetical protein